MGYLDFWFALFVAEMEKTQNFFADIYGNFKNFERFQVETNSESIQKKWKLEIGL